MSSEADAIYELLLIRYKEKGFLNPALALDSNIKGLIRKGRTREAAIRELDSSDSPWNYSLDADLTVSPPEKETEQNVAILGQIADLREKIDSLTTLYSKSEITEETYLRGAKKIEEDISRLQREHKIPKVEKRKRKPTSVFETARHETIEHADYRYQGSVSQAWWLVPFFFGLLGGIIAYVAVRDDDQEMANNLLIFGILWTLLLVFLWGILFLL